MRWYGLKVVVFDLAPKPHSRPFALRILSEKVCFVEGIYRLTPRISRQILSETLGRDYSGIVSDGIVFYVVYPRSTIKTIIEKC